MKKGLKKNMVVDHRIYLVQGRGNGCPRLKVLQVPEKNAPSPYEWLGSVSKDVCVLSSNGEELSYVWVMFGLCLECLFFEDREGKWGRKVKG